MPNKKREGLTSLLKLNNKRKVEMTIADVAVMLVNLVEASKDPNVGFEDANHSLQEIIRYFSTPITRWMEKNKLESILWACNMRAERKQFWHPHGAQFETWLTRMRFQDFDRRYNFFTDTEE